MKRCCKCKEEKELDQFSNKKGKKQPVCKECNKAYQKAHYISNKSDYLKNNKRREEINRKWFKAYKKTLVCSRCPENHPSCLDFHHVDPDKKKWAIGPNAHKISLKSLKEEIAKCIILCANCHRKEHYALFV